MPIFKTLKQEKETILKSYINSKKEIVFEQVNINVFDKVVYLGNSIHYGDVFMCGNLEDTDFGIYFGEKGTEF
jgi:hypothetical protein